MKTGRELIRVEKIFAYAVALQQSGRLRNTIYCLKKFIYILNQDHTVLIRFVSRDAESLFSSPVSFNANDYESGDFEEKGGRIHFRKKMGEWIKEKSCKTPQFEPLYIHKLFKKYLNKFDKTNKIVLNESFRDCLNEDLSHIEFSCKDGQMIAQQRDIYAGSVITIRPAEKNQLGAFDDKLKSFKPIGIRTNDFLALFQCPLKQADSKKEQIRIALYFSGQKVLWLENDGKSLPFKCLISHCLYDELGME